MDGMAMRLNLMRVVCLFEILCSSSFAQIALQGTVKSSLDKAAVQAAKVVAYRLLPQGADTLQAPIDSTITDYDGKFQFLLMTDVRTENSFPASFYLSNAYPNPFLRGTSWQISVPHPEQLSISIYNLLGQVVIQRQQTVGTGSYALEWQGFRMPGLYFAVIRYGAKSHTIKLMQLAASDAMPSLTITTSQIFQKPTDDAIQKAVSTDLPMRVIVTKEKFRPYISGPISFPSIDLNINLINMIERSQSVGSDATTIMIENGISTPLQLDIPDSAFYGTAEIKITELENGQIPENDDKLAGSAFFIDIGDAKLNKPITIITEFDQNYDGNSLYLARYNGTEWEELPTKYLINSQKLVAETDEFSPISSWFRTDNTSPILESLTANPYEYSGVLSSLDIGEDLIFTVTVESPTSNFDYVLAKLTFSGLDQWAASSMSQMALAISGDARAIILGQTEFGATYHMIKQGDSWMFTIDKENIKEMIDGFGLQYIKCKAIAYSKTKSPQTETIRVEIYKRPRPCIILEYPLIIASQRPVFCWHWGCGGIIWRLEYKHGQIVIADSDNPWSFWYRDYEISTSWDDGEGIPDELELPSDIVLEFGKRYWWGVRLFWEPGWGYRDEIRSGLMSFVVKKDAETTKQLDIDRTTLRFGPEAHIQGGVVLTSNVGWSVECDASWLNVFPRNGAGDQHISVETSSENNSTEKRTTTITIIGGGITRTVTVAQEGINSVLEINPPTLRIGSAANSTGSFHVTSNSTWSISIDNSWLNCSQENGTGDQTIIVEASSANTSTSPRDATVTITSGGVVRRVTVTQEAGSSCETGFVYDKDSHRYLTVKIGSQWWMAENLEVTTYQNGDAIPNITSNAEWGSLASGAYCSSDYGNLYNWYAVNDGRQIAPIGWHVPDGGDWDTLIDFLGGDSEAGGKLKEEGTSDWASPNYGATNLFCFSALPAGKRFQGGNYGEAGTYAHFWTSDQQGGYGVWRYLYYNNTTVQSGVTYNRCGNSVRCVKD